MDALHSVQSSIRKALGSCDKAIGQPHTGKGNLVRKAEDFWHLGVKRKNTLPADSAMPHQRPR